MRTVDRNIYGTIETNGLVDGAAYHAEERGVRYWTEPGLKITRLRLLSDPGYPAWDVSYCHGMLEDGTLVDVLLPFSQVPKGKRFTFIRRMARRDGLNPDTLGILDCMSTLC
jgi:hypothetical protein